MKRFSILWAIGVVGYLAALLCIGGGMFFTNEADPSSLQGMLHQWLMEIWKVMTLPGRLFPKSSVIEAVVGVAVHSLLWGLLAPLLAAMLPNVHGEPRTPVRRASVSAGRLGSMDPLPKRIEEWARKNELQIVSAERRRFFVGPFSFQRNAGHVYRIVVRGRNEEVGEGWLSLQNSLFGADWEEVKWIRKPTHIMEPRSEDVVAQTVLGVGTMSPNASKWGIGVFISVSFIAWGLASLAYGRFVIPSRRNIVFEGTPGLLIALAAISFGLSSHLRLFWSINPKQTKALLLAAFGCLLLGLCVQLFEFLNG